MIVERTPDKRIQITRLTYTVQGFTNILQFLRRFLVYGECDDQDKECPLRADKGECTSNPVFMSKYCPWSCHKCAPKELSKKTAMEIDYRLTLFEQSV